MTTTDSKSSRADERDRDNSTLLTIELSPDLRKRIADAAARRDVSVEAYVEEVLEQAVPTSVEDSVRQRGRISQEAYDQLVAFQESLAREYHGKVFPDSVEEIRKMREERVRHLESLIHLENE